MSHFYLFIHRNFTIEIKINLQMKIIKVLGTGCAKCKTTIANVQEAVKQTGIEANIIKVEDIQEIMAYNVLSTPVLVIDEAIKVKGRIATVDEIKSFLTV